MAGADDGDFEAFFRAEYPAIVRAVYVLTANQAEAEDVAQEAFARLYAHWRKVSRYERPGAWVRRVAINIAVSSLRTLVRHSPGASDPDPADPDLHRAIVALPRLQRAAVVLHYYEDLPVGEVAAILGCSPNTVKVHMHRARKKLAAALSEDEV
jgi:RNA polymerase sigma-70 factor (ECF subfamily)